MKIVKLENSKIFSSNCYILINGGSFCVVDPSVSYDEAAEKIPEIQSLKLKYILLTHAHVDHMWEIESYVQKGGVVLVSAEDGPMLSNKNTNCALILRGPIDVYEGSYQTISQSDKIELSDVTVNVIATPGHTAGCVCFLAQNALFSGDTLFERGVFGRCDLPTSSLRDMYLSLNRLFELPDDLTVYPGHGNPTKLKATKNYFYNCN